MTDHTHEPAEVSMLAVRVRKLVWTQCQSTLPRVVFEAKSCFGRYVAFPNGNWKLHGAYGYEQDGDLSSAQSLAQAHHNSRIETEIEPAPDPRDAVIAQLVAALEKANHRLKRVPFNVAMEINAAIAAAKAVTK